MSNKMKLKRITDLFSEGDVCYLGDDETGAPVCVWMNKPNSIEEEEARLDAQSARTEVLVAMANPNHAEIVNARMAIEEMTDEEVYEVALNRTLDQSLALASLDVESDKEWIEKLEYLRRHQELMDDAGVKDDDPRRVEFQKTNDEYISAVEAKFEERKKAKMEELKEKGREEAVESFIKQIKDDIALDHYMLERRITQMFYAVRECEATSDQDRKEWDHSKCSHDKRLFSDRKEVRELPENVLTKMNVKFESIQVGARNVSNFPEPQSSSESSAQPSN